VTLEQYIGVDIIPELIARNQSLYGNERTRFVLLDLTRDELPRVDVILCRDCFIHFSYLLTNTYREWRQNENIRTGEFRHLNLRLPSFNFPPPVRQLDEKSPEEQAQFFGKMLGLWKLADL